MPIYVPGVLLSIADLESHLHRAIGAADRPSAQSAVDYAAVLVGDVIGFDVTDTEFAVTEAEILLVRAIAVRIAAQWFTNPEDRASYAGPEGLSFTASPQMLSKIMSEVDRRTLVGVQLRYAPGFA